MWPRWLQIRGSTQVNAANATNIEQKEDNQNKVWTCEFRKTWITISFWQVKRIGRTEGPPFASILAADFSVGESCTSGPLPWTNYTHIVNDDLMIFMNRPIDLNQYFQTRGHRPRSAFSGGRRWKSVVWECLETRPRVCRFVLVKSALIEIRWIQISDLTTGLTVLYLKRVRTDCIDLRQRNSQISTMFSGKPRPRVFWVCLWCKENPTVWIARWHEWPESSSKRIHSDTWPNCTSRYSACINQIAPLLTSKSSAYLSDFVGVTGLAEICLKSWS